MALVAYGSSDSESDTEDIEDRPEPQLKEFMTTSTSTSSSTITSFDQLDLIEDLDNDHPPKFNLPAPIINQSNWAEDEDEFLAKKVTYRGPIEKPPPPPVTKKMKSTTVKIVLPALSTFSSFKQKESTVITGPQPAKTTSLLDMLPKPKQNFPAATKKKVLQGTSSLVPDSITRKAKAPIPTTSKGKPGTSKTLNNAASKTQSDSDGSDDEDFFSLNREDDALPEVSIAEINAMVATKSARINQTIKQHEAKVAAEAAQIQEDQEAAESAAAAALVDEQAITALCGSRAKRARKDEINIIDVSGDHLINRDEWIRNQLTAATEYQPRGLVDEEPGAGTKRKHQITYLAHQAKANEQELQAMWATNRHTRRQTQNKYGF